ncbi:MAG: hypothetical protein LBE03_00075 [Candidatus Nomurabacteria bacterium]|jgi:hypothetical protein|nr:hypothetical protein [Candidatus Nomurabacteria bacterium]
MSSGLIFFLVAVLIVGALLFFAISATKHKVVVLDKDQYQADWLAIENELLKEDEKTYNIAVLEADKLVDKILIEIGAAGKTMGERLKSEGARFSNLNGVWYVHKLRNQIAHERGFSVSFEQARRSLSVYKQALQDLGAI